MKTLKRAISWLLFPLWFFLAALVVTLSVLRWRHAGKAIDLMNRFVNWNDTVLMGRK